MSVKLYRHNESGEKVYAEFLDTGEVNIFEQSHMEDKTPFLRDYTLIDTPLPEAPEVGSTAWAWQMLEAGEKISHPTLDGGYLYLSEDNILMWSLHNCVFSSITQSLTDWQLYSPPKPIVELLPHEFEWGQEVLVRDSVTGTWQKRIFHQMYFENKSVYGTSMPKDIVCHDAEKGIMKYKYCLPYAENKHIKHITTDGEHGAVPRGYVPPHVPQLGDHDYWCVGDTVYDLLLHKYSNIEEITVGADGKPCGIVSCPIKAFEGRNYALDGQGSHSQRSLFHAKAITLDKLGRILSIDYDYAPTRPHRIES